LGAVLIAPAGAPARQSVDGYLREVAGLLWPGSLIRHHSPWSARDSGYLVLPSAARPKLIVPNRPARVSAAAIRNYNTGAGRREQLMISAAAMALRTGLGRFAPNLISVPSDHPGSGPVAVDVRTHLSMQLGFSIDVALYIGPARAVRKPLLQVLDRRGHTVGFAKLGVDDFTRALVQHEAAALDELHRCSPRWVVPPPVLHHGRWHGHELLVLGALRRGAAVPADDPVLARAADEIARLKQVSSGSLPASSYWRRLVARQAALPATMFTPMLRASMTRLGERAPGVVAFGSWHGDWAPWNLTVADGRVRAWDWEKFQSDVPIGYDTIHYSVHGMSALTRRTPLQAFQLTLDYAPRLLRPHGIHSRSALVVFWLYALELATRYLEDGEGEAGTTAMSRLADWLEPVLEAVQQRAEVSVG
jgi:hypothetical protein